MHKAKERLAKMERKHLIAACAVVVILAAGTIAVTLALVMKTQVPPATTANFKISGEVVCLPHKNTSGPQTLECAFGLRSDDNRYYALQDMPQPPSVNTGDRVEVQGALTAGGDSIYDIVGTIKVQNLIH